MNHMMFLLRLNVGSLIQITTVSNVLFIGRVLEQCYNSRSKLRIKSPMVREPEKKVQSDFVPRSSFGFITTQDHWLLIGIMCPN